MILLLEDKDAMLHINIRQQGVSALQSTPRTLLRRSE
jgi:hypothetical protein